MYCMNCGSNNPDSAKFCNNCGKAMKSAPVSRSGGFFKRLIVTAVVFAVFYAIGYGISSRPDKETRGVETSTEYVQNKPTVSAQPKVTETKEDGYIDNLGGSWEQVKLKDGNFSLSVSALSFSQTVYDCTEFTVNMDVTMNANTHCKDWQVWGRTGGKFKKIGKVYLPDGDGYVSQRLTFATPVTFDSIAITPTIPGGYSWSMALGITDVYTR